MAKRGVKPKLPMVDEPLGITPEMLGDGHQPVPENPAREKWRRQYKDKSPELVKQIGRAYLQGMGIFDLAKKFGFHYSTITKWVDECREIWKAQVKDEMWLELAKVDALEAFAWDQLNRSKRKFKTEVTKLEATEGTTVGQKPTSDLKAIASEDGWDEPITEPLEAKQIKQAAENVGASMTVVERVVKETRSTASTGWAAVIQWCIDYRTKVTGGYAPDRIHVTGEFRVAGHSSREEALRELGERINRAAGAHN